MCDQTPPNDEQAERALLGHALNLGRIPSGVNGLAPTDFYRPINEAIWAAMRSLSEQGRPSDFTTVRAYLHEHGKLDAPGGVPSQSLVEMTGAPPIADPAYTAEIIGEHSRRRQAIESYQRGLQRSQDLTSDLDEVLQRTAEELGRVAGRGDQESEPAYLFTPGGNFILDTDPTPRAQWGDGDQVLWAEGEALVIAGAQGLGKTTLAQQLALGWCGFHKYAKLLDFPIRQGRRVLYLAMDRPRQAARSFRRMVSENQRVELDDRLVVWQGPPPNDLAKHTTLLLDLCNKAGADIVIVDSLKDAAIGLSDDEVGAGYNRARQTAIAAGVEVVELHHLRKLPNGKSGRPPALDDLYGSTWLTSGAGSVVMLTGEPGDALVGLHHLKQPASVVGPYQVMHDQETGRSSIFHQVDLVKLSRTKADGITAVDAAKAMFDTDSVKPAQKEKARRKLEQLAKSGLVAVVIEGDKETNTATHWRAPEAEKWGAPYVEN